MTNITKGLQKKLFELLLKSRRLEEVLIELIMAGDITGWLHPMLGHEAVGVGVATCLEKKDIINNTHRGRGINIAKGVSLERFMAEALGRQGGPSGGIGGEMHFCDAENGILGNSGLVGATVPVAVGVAMASKHLKTGQVVVSVCGDGTVDEGNFHESVNIASVWKLPIVFVIDNNEWAQFTPQRETAGQIEIWKKAEGYGMPGIVADGADVIEVYKTAQAAIARARRGDGPTLIEYKVPRWMGHYIGDAQAYRDAEDIEKARQIDPVSRYQSVLLKKGIITSDYIQKLEKNIDEEIKEAVNYAKSLPFASVEQAFKYIYAEDGEL